MNIWSFLQSQNLNAIINLNEWHVIIKRQENALIHQICYSKLIFPLKVFPFDALHIRFRHMRTHFYQKRKEKRKKRTGNEFKKAYKVCKIEQENLTAKIHLNWTNLTSKESLVPAFQLESILNVSSFQLIAIFLKI